MFYRAGDWDDLQIDLHVSLHVGFKIQFAGIVPVFLEFNGFHFHFRSPSFFSRDHAFSATDFVFIPQLSKHTIESQGPMIWMDHTGQSPKSWVFRILSNFGTNVFDPGTRKFTFFPLRLTTFHMIEHKCLIFLNILFTSWVLPLT